MTSGFSVGKIAIIVFVIIRQSFWSYECFNIMYIESLRSEIPRLSSKATNVFRKRENLYFITLLQNVTGFTLTVPFFLLYRTHPRRRVMRVVRQRAQRTNHNNKGLVSSVCDTFIWYLRAIIHELVFVSMLNFFFSFFT